MRKNRELGSEIPMELPARETFVLDACINTTPIINGNLITSILSDDILSSFITASGQNESIPFKCYNCTAIKKFTPLINPDFSSPDTKNDQYMHGAFYLLPDRINYHNDCR